MGDSDAKIGILYWGSRGGGKTLTDQLISEAQTRGNLIATYLRPNRKGSEIPIKVYSVGGWLRERRRVLEESAISEITEMIFPMASPWDIFLGLRLKKLGINVTRIIHDAEPHPGDHFPPRLWIRALCFDCTKIVVLSQHVSNLLIKLKYSKKSRVLVGRLPGAAIPLPKKSENSLPRNKFLFLGRGRKYKGLALLLASWPYVGDHNSTLTIAGEGHKVKKTDSRVHHINRWLSDHEILELIENSEVLVFPYIEGSQSGIIPTAISFCRPVVITPVGGLSEQVKHGENGIISKSVDSISFAEAMNAARIGKFKFEKEASGVNSSQTLLETCLLRL